MSMLAEFGSGQVLLSIFWLFLFIIWFWLLITIFGDIFRSDDMGGGLKALWSIFVILLPYLGIFIYLIVRGKGMQQRQLDQMKQQQAAQQEYIRSVAAPAAGNATEEIARAADLRDKGAITEEEFQAIKAKALS